MTTETTTGTSAQRTIDDREIEDRGRSRTTRALLWAAASAGPIFYLSSTLQAVAREGFDIRTHPLSQLATGDLGWIQTLSFLVAGLGGVALAAAYRRLHREGVGHRLAPLFIALFGIGFMLAGAFPMDPQRGFPPGAPTGVVPMSWHSIVHTAAAVLSFLALAAACIVLLVASIRDRRAAASIGHGVVALVLLLPVSPTGSSIQVALTGLVAFGWVTTMALRLRASA